MKKLNKFAVFAMFTAIGFMAAVALQYIFDVNGITRMFYQWWTDWSGINFVGMLDYAYGTALFHVCAWLFCGCASVYFGSCVAEVYAWKLKID